MQREAIRIVIDVNILAVLICISGKMNLRPSDVSVEVAFQVERHFLIQSNELHPSGDLKAYKEGDEWKYTNSFNIEDLPKVALVANEAYKYIRLKSTDSDE